MLLTESQDRPTPENIAREAIRDEIRSEIRKEVIEEISNEMRNEGREEIGAQRRLEPIYSLPSQHTPHKFKGTKDPLMADDWTKQVESTMDLFSMTDREKVRYASFLMRGEARVWWDLVKETRNVDLMT